MTYAKLILEIPKGAVGSFSQVFPLSGNRIRLGRSPDCPIRFDSQSYGGVSRYHATLQRVTTHPHHLPSWQLCDEGSANGTFVNGKPIRGCVTLAPGDQIMLSQDGPILTYTLENYALENSSPQSETESAQADSPQTATAPQPLPPRPLPPAPVNVTQGNPSLSQLIPVVSSRRNLKSFLSKGYILPGVILILWVVGLFFSGGNLGFFIESLGIFLGAIAYSFIYRLCGKRKPWWEITAAIILTMLLLLIPWFIGPFLFFFRGILPGNIDGAGNNFFNLFIAHFLGLD
ncbi:MAG: FHA domain-containing protein [Acaryochloridaceae cyanobacterium RL_2_7]|nr:FHA domain-containing protein [Acaryochloridaceae cyanobacterium RL_2_7]